MVITKGTVMSVILVMIFSFGVWVSPLSADQETYISFLMRAEMRDQWKAKLLQDIPERNESEKWVSLWNERNVHKRVSSGLSLINPDPGTRLYEDLSMVDGFSKIDNPGDEMIVPRQLLIIQASLASLSLLCEVKTPEALGVARDIVKGLWKNPEFRHFIDRVGEKRASDLYDVFSTSRGIFSIYKGEFT